MLFIAGTDSASNDKNDSKDIGQNGAYADLNPSTLDANDTAGPYESLDISQSGMYANLSRTGGPVD